MCALVFAAAACSASPDYGKADELPSPFNAPQFAGRFALVRKSQRIDLECVVRAYLMGSGYKEYLASQTLAGEKLPAGLGKGAKLPQPVFTPAVKNDSGHDENISFAEMQKRLSPSESRGLSTAATGGLSDLAQTRGVFRLRAHAPGIYRVRAVDGPGAGTALLLPVNQASAPASDLHHRLADLQLPAEALAGAAPSPLPVSDGPLWTLILLALSGLVVLEWATYHRRVTV